MARNPKRILNRVEVDGEKFRRLAIERGFVNIEAITERAKELGSTLSLATTYSILSNSNFQRDSLETLSLVTGISLEEFVTFEPDTINRRR